MTDKSVPVHTKVTVLAVRTSSVVVCSMACIKDRICSAPIYRIQWEGGLFSYFFKSLYFKSGQSVTHSVSKVTSENIK